MPTLRPALALAAAVCLSACSSKSSDPPPHAQETTVAFDLSADFTKESSFFSFPYPSDLRLSASGGPIGSAFPNPLGKTLVEGLRSIAGDRAGFPVMPVAYFHFSAAVAQRNIDDVIAANAGSPILLVDIDPASPDRGALIPTVAATLPVDDYVPEHVLGVAPRPGFVLHGKRTYAFVIKRALGDAAGAPLGVPVTLAQLATSQPQPGARGEDARKLYAPLWTTLKEKLSIDAADVAAATVFTTGDVVVDLAALTDKVVAKYSVTIDGLKVPEGGAHDRYCELTGTVTYPQFQRGKPPYNTDGTFDTSDPSGVPTKQRDEVAPIALTLPNGPMPAGGFPLVVFFHGSGGLSTAIVNRGPVLVKGGPDVLGQGPGYVVAPLGIAMAGSALPVNPERLPGAKETEYINFANLAAFRDTFRQGVIEQRLFIAALRTLTIPASVVASCPALSLPSGETAYRFSETTPLMAQGQSMGGMYTNIIGAVEPRIKAVVPTGAGGYWSYFITKTKLYDDTATLIASLLGTDPAITFMHPTLHLLQTAWEPSDPFVYMPRLARRALPGHPVRSIYEPVGKDDSYFPTVLYDAIALSYGHPEAGTVVWPTMQDALKLGGLDGVRDFPLSLNLASEDGKTKYTGAIVQYAGDGLDDPHAIYKQLDAVKYQYGCFYSTLLSTGTASIVAPQKLGTPCVGK